MFSFYISNWGSYSSHRVFYIHPTGFSIHHIELPIHLIEFPIHPIGFPIFTPLGFLFIPLSFLFISLSFLFIPLSFLYSSHWVSVSSHRVSYIHPTGFPICPIEFPIHSIEFPIFIPLGLLFIPLSFLFIPISYSCFTSEACQRYSVQASTRLVQNEYIYDVRTLSQSVVLHLFVYTILLASILIQPITDQHVVLWDCCSTVIYKYVHDHGVGESWGPPIFGGPQYCKRKGGMGVLHLHAHSYSFST